MPRAGRLLVLLVGVLMVVGGVVGCGPRRPPASHAAVPTLGVVVGHAGECAVDTAAIRTQADGMLRWELPQAGYTTLFVVCDDPVPAVDDPALREWLESAGLTVLRVPLSDPRVAHTIPGGVPPNVLRTQITRRIMLAQSLVLTGDVDLLPDGSFALLTVPDVLAVARDTRATPGAPVAGNQDIYSRAVGATGLVVSLSNSTPERRTVSVAIAELNLSGDDTVPATNLWTGQRLLSHGGKLSVDLDGGNTALLRIG